MSLIGRRRFLYGSIVTGASAGLVDLSFLSGLPAVAAAEAAGRVQLRAEIEPLVEFVEETPRDRLLEETAARIRDGLSYQDVLAALLLAGVRNVQPRPSVGFKFHAVLVVNSAHLASLASPDADRWLPIFWALDYFKSSQARDVREGNWTMGPVDAAKLPSGAQARSEFQKAMERWDEEAADAAVASLVRHAGANQMLDVFARYGIRDYRSIGHKAIYVANSWRTLQCIGWQHSEPVLRSLAYALLNHQNEPNPSESDLDADRPWRRNQERRQELRADWLNGKDSDSATRELLDTLRTGSNDDACQQVVRLLNDGVSTTSVYDAIFAGAGELLMRQPGIVALHAMTTSNAMRYLFETVNDEPTRQLVILQNAAFLPMFRDSMQGRGAVGNARIDQLAPADLDSSTGDAVESIFANVSDDRPVAAQQVLAYLDQGHSPAELIDTARQLIFLKGRDSHDYKFSSAVLEDFYKISPAWGKRYLASSVFNLKGLNDSDNRLTERTRSALNG